jgi:hypothetical protein
MPISGVTNKKCIRHHLGLNRQTDSKTNFHKYRASKPIVFNKGFFLQRKILNISKNIVGKKIPINEKIQSKS